MIRIAAAVVMSLCVGAAAGAFWVQQRSASEDSAPKPAAVEPRLSEKESDRMRRLDEENESLHAQLDSMLKENERLQQQFDEAVYQASLMPLSEEPAAETPVSEDRRQRRDPFEGMPKEEREKRMEEMRQAQEAQWTAMVQERENILAFFEDRMNNSPNAAERERLAALFEYQNYTTELRERMTGTETPEERRAIYEEMQAARQGTDELVRQLQNGELARVTKEISEADAANGRDFVRGIREVMEGPYFDLERTFLRGGFGGPGGGPPQGGPWGGGRSRGGGRDGGGGEPRTREPR